METILRSLTLYLKKITKTHLTQHLLELILKNKITVFKHYLFFLQNKRFSSPIFNVRSSTSCLEELAPSAVILGPEVPLSNRAYGSE